MRLSNVLWVTPIVIIVILGFAFPLTYSLYLSLTKQTPDGLRFVGIENYVEVVYDHNFYLSMVYTIGYSLLSLTGSLAMGVGVALVIISLGRGRKVLEAIFTAPIAVSPLIAGILWSPAAVWDDVNSLLHMSLGLPYIDITDPVIYFPIMALTESWLWSRLFMLAALVVIESTPKECLEAAHIMGAGKREIILHMYIPSLLRSRIILALAVIKVMDFFRAFEVPFAWSNWVRATQIGSPTDTISLLLFKQLITPAAGIPQIPYITSVSTLLMLVSLAVGVTLHRLLLKGE